MGMIFFKILIHNILLFKIKLTIRFTFFFQTTEYAMTQPKFFHHYRELQEDSPHDTIWLDQIPREQWTLAWDDGKWWGHMTTNLAESLNSVLKKMRNFPITALVKAMYEKLNKYFIDRGTQADAMIVFRQVYTLIASKFITKEETKSNTHCVQQFDRQRFKFQVEEIINSRGVNEIFV